MEASYQHRSPATLEPGKNSGTVRIQDWVSPRAPVKGLGNKEASCPYLHSKLGLSRP